MKKWVGIYIGVVVFVGILYSQEKDPALEFVENAIKIYPDSVWIDPEYLEYLSDDVRMKIQTLPKTEKEFEDFLTNYKYISGVSINTFEDIKNFIKIFAGSYKWYIYWRKRGVDYYEWRKIVLKSFAKARGFKKFLNIVKRRKRSFSLKKIFENEENIKMEPLYYSDAVIEGILTKIEEHPEETIYKRWLYIKVNKTLWGEEKKEIIIKIPWFRIKGTGFAISDLTGSLSLFEDDIGEEYIFFLTHFPFNKLLSFPYIIYAWKVDKKEWKGKDLKYLEDSLLSWYERKEIRVEELPSGIYQPMYLARSLRKFKEQVSWYEYEESDFLKGIRPELVVPYSQVISVLNYVFNRREK